MTCEDCIHYDVCYIDDELYPSEKVEKLCSLFRNKSNILELPCKAGDKVYINGVPLVISFIAIDPKLYFVVQFDCDDCGDCPFYEDDVSFEGEHDCRTQGYLEFTLDDIGKTVFLSDESVQKNDN